MIDEEVKEGFLDDISTRIEKNKKEVNKKGWKNTAKDYINGARDFLNKKVQYGHNTGREPYSDVSKRMKSGEPPPETSVSRPDSLDKTIDFAKEIGKGLEGYASKAGGTLGQAWHNIRTGQHINVQPESGKKKMNEEDKTYYKPETKYTMPAKMTGMPTFSNQGRETTQDELNAQRAERGIRNRTTMIDTTTKTQLGGSEIDPKKFFYPGLAGASKRSTLPEGTTTPQTGGDLQFKQGSTGRGDISSSGTTGPERSPTTPKTNTESGKKKMSEETTNPLIVAFLKLQNTKSDNIFEAAKKLAKKDYDKDGKIESPKDEVWGSRFRAAKKAGKMEEESRYDNKNPFDPKDPSVQGSGDVTSTPKHIKPTDPERIKNFKDPRDPSVQGSGDVTVSGKPARVKEEIEQIDEIGDTPKGREALMSYQRKAHGQIMSPKGEVPEPTKFKRTVGLHQAAARYVKGKKSVSEENVEEAYGSKGRPGGGTKHAPYRRMNWYPGQGSASLGSPEETKSAIEKHFKAPKVRDATPEEMAAVRAREKPGRLLPKNEEVTFSEEEIAFFNHVMEAEPINKKDVRDSDQTGIKSTYAGGNITDETIDELSKNTLVSYALKAHNRGDMASRMSHSGKDKDMSNYANKRYHGVQTAIKKIADKK